MNTIWHFTDYDGTIVPMTADIEKGIMPEADVELYNGYIGKNPDIKVVFVTGRSVDSMQKQLQRYGIVKPQYIIGSGGAEIYDFNAGVPVKEWEDFINAKGFSWQAANDAVMAEIDFPMEYDRDEQAAAKLAYELPNATDEQLKSVRSALDKHGIKANVMYLSNAFIDILPEGIDKGVAVDFLIKLADIPRERVIVSGDSRNDVDMFTCRLGFKVAPANADEVMRRHLVKLNVTDVYYAAAARSSGTIEGIEAFKRKLAVTPFL